MDAFRQSHSASLSQRSPSTLTNDDIEAVIQMATSSRASSEVRSSSTKDTRTQLFVGNLPYRVRWQDLKDLFRRAGTVLRADVSLGPDNRSRGYGTVLLATAEDAGRAIDLFNGYSWQTRILEVRPDRLPPDYDANHPPAIVAAPHDDDQLDYSAILDLHHNSTANLSLRSLFVGNLPFHCQWQDLKDLFRQAGAVMRADVALGQDGRSRGFGTVTFATEGDADRAVKMFNGYEYNGRTLKVNHDKFTQLSQPNLGGSSLTTPSSMSPASISPAPSIRSAPDSRITLPSTLTTRHLTQPGRLSIGHHHLGLGSTSSSPAPFDIWQESSHEHERDRDRDLLRSFPGIDLGVTRTASTFSNYSAPAPTTASRSTSTSSSKPPSIATAASTGNLISSSSFSSTPGSSENLPLGFQRHPSKKNSPPASSATAASTITPQQVQSRLQTHRSPPRHPGPIALPPPPHVASFSHNHLPNLSPHGHPLPGFSPLHHPHSPLYHSMMHHQQQVEQIKQLQLQQHQQQQQQQQYQITPLGLPPMTPSMPSFNFLPPGPGSPSASATGTGQGHPYSPYAHPLPSPLQMPHTHSHMSMMMQNGQPGSPLHHPHPHPHPHPAPFGITPLSPPTSATAPTFAAAAAAASTHPHTHYPHPHPHPHTPLTFSPGVTMSPGAFWGRPGAGASNPLLNPAVGAPVHGHAQHAQEPTGYFDGAWFGSGNGNGSGLVNEILKDKGGGDVLDDKRGIGRKVGGEVEEEEEEEEEAPHTNGDTTDTAATTTASPSPSPDPSTSPEPEEKRTRARRHSSTTTTPWQTHPSAPGPDFRAWARERSERDPEPDSDDVVDLNSELAALALVDGSGSGMSRTHSMEVKKPVEVGLHLQDGASGSVNANAVLGGLVEPTGVLPAVV